jgi:hypothetical protein
MKKIAFLVVGEMFRSGGQYTRIKDTPESYSPQKEACASHISLANRLIDLGFETEFFIESYATKNEIEMKSWYGDRLKICNLRETLVGLENLTRQALANLESVYDCVFVCRGDLLLKDMFIDCFDPSWDSVLFPFACWINQHMHFNKPRVSDTMMFIPGRLIDELKNRLFISHEAWWNFVEHKVLSDDDLGFMINTYHDSDSEKDYNPLYRMVGRKESSFWYSIGYVVGPNFEPVATEERKKFPDWSPRSILNPDETEKSLDDMWEWWHKETGRLPRFIDLIGFSNEQTIKNYRHHEVKYWKQDGDDLVITGDGGQVTVRFKKKSDHTYEGNHESNREVSFVIKKVNTHAWHDKKKISLCIRKKKTKVALCIRGGVSRKSGDSRFLGSIYENETKQYANYKAVFNSVKKHILECNKNKDIDIFLHSWTEELKDELESLYHPKSSIFENNNNYAEDILKRCRHPMEFSGISQALAIKKSIEVKEEYELSNGVNYDAVLLYRPDVLIWKDMVLDEYDIKKGIFVNAHPNKNGDYHFFMSSEDASLFKNLYESPFAGNHYAMHHWIRSYIENFMKRPLHMDKIVPGEYQEIARPNKMLAYPIKVYNISPDFFTQYGMSMEDLGLS